jgi:hypothetical protein
MEAENLMSVAVWLGTSSAIAVGYGWFGIVVVSAPANFHYHGTFAF